MTKLWDFQKIFDEIAKDDRLLDIIDQSKKQKNQSFHIPDNVTHDVLQRLLGNDLDLDDMKFIMQNGYVRRIGGFSRLLFKRNPWNIIVLPEMMSVDFHCIFQDASNVDIIRTLVDNSSDLRKEMLNVMEILRPYEGENQMEKVSFPIFPSEILKNVIIGEMIKQEKIPETEKIDISSIQIDRKKRKMEIKCWTQGIGFSIIEIPMSAMFEAILNDTEKQK